MNVMLARRMTVDEFLALSLQQDKGRYELQDGVVIMQQAQNWGHLRTKGRIYTLLLSAIEQSGAAAFAAIDGATVRIGPRTAFEPDALVAPLPLPDDTSLEIPNPVIVVEVLSLSSVKRDLADKVAGYFHVPSVVHYLVLDPEDMSVIWHRRAPAGGLEPPATLKEGMLHLDPLGIALQIEQIFQ